MNSTNRKLLAKYLSDYIYHERGTPVPADEIEEPLDAFESTENCTIELLRNQIQTANTC